MPTFNDWGSRVSPHSRQAYDTIYSRGRIPAENDPGWLNYQHKTSGTAVRMIRVHGPFDLEGTRPGPEVHCEDGWLGVTSQGLLIAVSDRDGGPLEPISQFEVVR